MISGLTTKVPKPIFAISSSVSMMATANEPVDQDTRLNHIYSASSLRNDNLTNDNSNKVQKGLMTNDTDGGRTKPRPDPFKTAIVKRHNDQQVLVANCAKLQTAPNEALPNLLDLQSAVPVPRDEEIERLTRENRRFRLERDEARVLIESLQKTTIPDLEQQVNQLQLEKGQFLDERHNSSSEALLSERTMKQELEALIKENESLKRAALAAEHARQILCSAFECSNDRVAVSNSTIGAQFNPPTNVISDGVHCDDPQWILPRDPSTDARGDENAPVHAKLYKNGRGGIYDVWRPKNLGRQRSCERWDVPTHASDLRRDSRRPSVRHDDVDVSNKTRNPRVVLHQA